MVKKPEVIVTAPLPGKHITSLPKHNNITSLPYVVDDVTAPLTETIPVPKSASRQSKKVLFKMLIWFSTVSQISATTGPGAAAQARQLIHLLCLFF